MLDKKKGIITYPFYRLISVKPRNNYTKPKKYNKVRFTHHFWRDIASGASYASYTSKTLTIGFGISFRYTDTNFILRSDA